MPRPPLVAAVVLVVVVVLMVVVLVVVVLPSAWARACSRQRGATAAVDKAAAPHLSTPQQGTRRTPLAFTARWSAFRSSARGREAQHKKGSPEQVVVVLVVVVLVVVGVLREERWACHLQARSAAAPRRRLTLGSVCRWRGEAVGTVLDTQWQQVRVNPRCRWACHSRRSQRQPAP